jgi:hypothetical protein
MADGSEGTVPPIAEPSRPPVAAPVVIEPGARGALAAEHISMQRSAVARVNTHELRVEQGAVAAAQADQVTIDRGALGAAMADRVELSRGYARSILARQVQLDRSAARIVIAADVSASQSAAMLLVARKVDGNIKVLFDWRGALAFGAVAGVVFALLSRVRGGRGARGKGSK